VRVPLLEIANSLGLGNARIGFELGPVSEPSSYAAMNLYGGRMDDLLKSVVPHARLSPATELLSNLSKILTAREIAKVKQSCAIAAEAFGEGRRHLRSGMRETEAANAFRSRLADPGEEYGEVERADGFVYCMSGENSYEASAAFQRSRRQRLQDGDLVLIHCNSYADGFWTDITRTYCMGEPDEKKQKIFEAILSASEAAIGQIRPGIEAKTVDAAARDVLTEYGLGDEFVHGLGHAVGFHAIDHNAPPRLRPASPDVLEEGMVFNVEPAVYIQGYGGVRHCDMVAVTANGAEMLTPFQSSIKQLVLGKVPAAKGSIW
ncbi:MAG TPA: Xaa-Pro peptidase family protein, partial [Pyrinomonadaceae bacterium]|nr:Xaa-Pro peptidase family protein [Pyrinomonadaceae bacterium]